MNGTNLQVSQVSTVLISTPQRLADEQKKGGFGELMRESSELDEGDQRRREAEVLQDRLRLRALLNQSAAGICQCDLTGRFVLVNSRYCQLLGYTEAELLAMRMQDVTHPEDLKSSLESFAAVMSGGPDFTVEKRYLRKDRSILWVSVTVGTFREEGRVLYAVAVVHDITGRKRAEEAWLEQLTLTRTIGDNSTQAIFMMNEGGYCTFMNPAAEKMLGFTPEEIRSRPLHDIIHHHHPDGRPYPMAECPIDRALPENFDIREHEDVFIRKNGEFFPVLVAASPIFKDGKPTATVVEVRDITERKRAEAAVQSAQKELQDYAAGLERTVEERTSKLQEAISELQTLSYSMAHDIRAPLRAMAAFSDLLIQEAAASGLSSQSAEYCRRISAAVSRLDRMILDVLHYTSTVLKEVSLVPVNLSVLLHSLTESYPNLSRDSADIQIAENLPVVLGTDALLAQCFANLLGNAVKFVPQGRKPQIRIWAELSGSKARVWVEDNGIGIPKGAQERLFRLFERIDNNKFEGTGLGLAIVRKVVEKIGGKVGVESSPGEGSRFWVELCLSDATDSKQ